MLFLFCLRVVGRSCGLPDAFWPDLERIGKHENVALVLGWGTTSEVLKMLRIFDISNHTYSGHAKTNSGHVSI